VAGLDPADLRRAARASAGVLVTASEAAARRHPADLPTAMAAYVTRALGREPYSALSSRISVFVEDRQVIGCGVSVIMGRAVPAAWPVTAASLPPARRAAEARAHSGV
jgi:hypothetical protein